MKWFLGVDGGGSKTLSIVVDETGVCRGVGMAGGGNFQSAGGVDRARGEVAASIDIALAQAGIGRADVTAAYFGMAGADRPSDFEIVRGLLDPILPTDQWGFENDASIGIWAGTGDGVGVGVICGTGTNVIGFNAEGRRIQVGGMGYLFGDYAGGGLIGTVAFRAAMRGFEGRGRETMLYPMFCEHYGVAALLDLIDWQYEGRSLNVKALTPLVFDAAGRGDEVAREVLTDVGRDLGISANVAIRKLFEPGERVVVVGIGSVFQSATYPIMYDAFVAEMRSANPAVKPVILHCEPVFGAAFAAAKIGGVMVDDAFKSQLERTFPGRPEVA